MIIVAENARGTKEATYQTGTTDDHFIRGKGVKDMNGALDALHEGGIVSWRGTQRLGLLLKDIKDGVDRFAGYELVEDLMLDQFCPCSVLEFIQSGFEERSQFWRGMSRHGDESTSRIDGGIVSGVTPPITAQISLARGASYVTELGCRRAALWAQHNETSKRVGETKQWFVRKLIVARETRPRSTPVVVIIVENVPLSAVSILV